MKVVMTLLVRDEADIVDAQLAFHLNIGVDFVVATDHRSVDGTTEILESYARSGRLRLIREESEHVRQSAWVTRMARLAATEHGADWVLNTDADEFWWPRGSSVREVLAAVPSRYGVVRALIRSFLPRPDDGRGFSERMTVRLAAPAPINDPATPYRPALHVAHRADERILVGQGSHEVQGVSSRAMPGWFPFEVLHFPFRSPKQCAGKHVKTLGAWRGNLRGDLARARRYVEEGRPEAFYREVVVDDAALQRGLADGSFAEDTRLRDALRALRDGPFAGAKLSLPRPSAAEDVGVAVDSSCVAEAELVRLRRRTDELTVRLTALEQRRRRPGIPAGPWS
jgi:hypothetical protein